VSFILFLFFLFFLFLLSPPTHELVGLSVIISYRILSYQYEYCGEWPFWRQEEEERQDCSNTEQLQASARGEFGTEEIITADG